MYRRYYPPLRYHRFIKDVEIAQKKRVRNPLMALDVRLSRFGPPPVFTRQAESEAPASSAPQLASMIGLLRDCFHEIPETQWRPKQRRQIDSPMRQLGAILHPRASPKLTQLGAEPHGAVHAGACLWPVRVTATHRRAPCIAGLHSTARLIGSA